jgi:hypothetical protein
MNFRQMAINTFPTPKMAQDYTVTGYRVVVFNLVHPGMASGHNRSSFLKGKINSSMELGCFGKRMDSMFKIGGYSDFIIEWKYRRQKIKELRMLDEMVHKFIVMPYNFKCFQSIPLFLSL